MCQQLGIPGSVFEIRHFWSGHAPRHVSERYIKLMNDRQYRLEWAERLGTDSKFLAPLRYLGYSALFQR